jgi:vacuolar-type H+-ATPase subunit E/Vma4
MEFSKTVLRSIFLICISVGVISCDQQQGQIDHAQTVIKDAEKNIEKFGASDWEKLESEIAKLEKSLEDDRSKYTEKQIEDANKLIGKYRLLQLKKGVNEFKNTIKDAGQQIEGMFEGEGDKDSTGVN